MVVLVEVKMKNKMWFVGSSIFLALAMVMMLMSVLTAQAAPEAVTTPVSYPNRISDTVVRYPINFMLAKVTTADGRGTTYNLPGFNILDLQYIIDQGSTPNTVTLKLQNSCDGVNWVDQGTLVSANHADASNILQLNTFCRYANIYADVASTQTLTITVIGVAK